jgi:Flp pilus assembly protein CpaB
MEVALRASTLFAITLASLLGLGVAIAAKASGLLNFAKVEPTPIPPDRPPDIYVLVGTRNLFGGSVIEGRDVTIRPLRPNERAEFQRDPDRYFPPTPQAAALRILEHNIDADRPILKTDLRDLNLPDPVKTRLASHMRAVNVAIPKARCVGGMISPGDWVDVVLRSRISIGNDRQVMTRTASIAHNVRIIAKRNNLWPVLTPLPDNVPVDFTLEANPYRAALIEFSKDKGDIALVPLPAAEQKTLEANRLARLQVGELSTQGYFSEPDSTEYKDEDTRVSAFRNGDLPLDENDLIRIFNLKIEPPLAPPAPGPNIERYSGVRRLSSINFPAPDRGNVKRPVQVQFSSPMCTNCAGGDCPTCKK